MITLSLLSRKHFTTASFNNFIPQKINFSSIDNFLINQFTVCETKSSNNHQKFARFFSKSSQKSKIEILQERSKLGDRDAQFELGSYYLSKNNKMADFEKGIKYIKTAAENNQLFACYKYSRYLKKGFIVKKDLSKSLQYLTFAADNDLEIAQFKLATEYYEGGCFPRDLKRSHHYFCLSAANKNSTSCKIVGNFYIQGIGCNRDINLAKKYFELGSKLNCPVCKYHLSIIYKIDNKKESIDILKDSADLGFSEAQADYGKYLLLVEKNKKEAEKYFRLAANQNDPESNFKLWEILKGSNDNKRNNEAELFLKKAADLGHEMAMQYDCRVPENDDNSFGYHILSSLDFEPEKPKNIEKRETDFEFPAKHEIESQLKTLNDILNLSEKGFPEF